MRGDDDKPCGLSPVERLALVERFLSRDYITREQARELLGAPGRVEAMGDDDDGVVAPNPGLRAWLPDNAKRIVDRDCPPGVAYYGDESTWTFGLDREAPSELSSSPRPPTLSERIKGAWRGMVNGWKGAL